jgi:small conductance mechanosensitive channel
MPLFESVLRSFLYFGAFVMILDQLNFNVTALIAGASVLGVAIGFGAQAVVRDVLAGFFLLFEGLVQVGDVIRVGDVSGEVERVSLRTTLVRRYTGELVAIPNGQIVQIGNMSRGFMRAIVQVAVAYEIDLQRAMAIMHQVGQDWAAAHPDVVLAPPEVQGLLDFGTSGVTVRLVVKVKPPVYIAAERELRLRLKAAFDAEKIQMSSPSRVVYLRGAPGPESDHAPEPDATPESARAPEVESAS